MHPKSNKSMIERKLANLISDYLQQKKVLVVIGARQVGKTTLLESFCKDKNTLKLNCDDTDDAMSITGRSSTELAHMLSPYEFVFIDEAQRVKDIGLTLKMIGDLKLNTQVVATGSSSLDLANDIKEAATGRLLEFNLFPFSLSELAAHSSWKDERRLLSQRMVYGLYPNVVKNPAKVKRTLKTIVDSYLYKDVFAYRGLKKPDVLQKLVKALALQIGSEVSYNELSNLLGVDKETVENYINLLEKCYVVFRLDSFSRNMRNEIKRGKKVYFYDNGVRNAILSNFAPLELRNDCGELWENMMVSERVKRNAYTDSFAQLYFWRTHDQREIDLIEEEDGILHGYEFKWNSKRKASMPTSFATAYPNSTFEVITPDNFQSFVE